MQSLNNIYILHIKRQIFWLSVKAAASGVMWYCETQPSFEKGAINYHFLEQQREFKIGIVQEQRRQREGTPFSNIFIFKPSPRFEHYHEDFCNDFDNDTWYLALTWANNILTYFITKKSCMSLPKSRMQFLKQNLESLALHWLCEILYVPP